MRSGQYKVGVKTNRKILLSVEETLIGFRSERSRWMQYERGHRPCLRTSGYKHIQIIPGNFQVTSKLERKQASQIGTPSFRLSDHIKLLYNAIRNVKKSSSSHYHVMNLTSDNVQKNKSIISQYKIIIIQISLPIFSFSSIRHEPRQGKATRTILDLYI